jgi:hypothetical protein
VIDLLGVRLVADRGAERVYALRTRDGSTREIVVPMHVIEVGPERVGATGDLTVMESWAIEQKLIAPGGRR